jgi:hypothetical protein
MPLIGTGKHRFPEDVVLRVMREEFVKFSSMYLPGTLKEIQLVRFDQGMRRTSVPAQPVSGKLLKKSYQILLRPWVQTWPGKTIKYCCGINFFCP